LNRDKREAFNAITIIESHRAILENDLDAVIEDIERVNKKRQYFKNLLANEC
jgi:hypothetical protein